MQQLRFFFLCSGFTLHVSDDNLTHHQEYICCIWLILVSQVRLLGVDEYNICGSEHHAL